MQIVIVSGLSGSGKSVALDTLEDHGARCVDNMPPPLLLDYARWLLRPGAPRAEQAAIGIDARAGAADLARFPELLEQARALPCEVTVAFLDADDDALLRRYSDTRRRHPLADRAPTLREAVAQERRTLAPVADRADLRLDTSDTNVHQLRVLVRDRLARERRPLSVLLQSFAYRRGVPSDSDFVFDSRCLPNPHWVPELRARTGADPAVGDYLDAQPASRRMRDELLGLLRRWLPDFLDASRHYLNVSVGCTGGQHRSVYLVERLAAALRDDRQLAVTVRHRDLEEARP